MVRPAGQVIREGLIGAGRPGGDAGVRATQRFVRARSAGSHRHVNKDAPGHNRGDAPRARAAIETALRAGHSVVVDNVNATPRERATPDRAGPRPRRAGSWPTIETAVANAVKGNPRRTGTEMPDAAIHVAARRSSRRRAAEGFDWCAFRIRPEFGRGALHRDRRIRRPATGHPWSTALKKLP